MGDAPFPLKYSPKVIHPHVKLMYHVSSISYAFGRWRFSHVILAWYIATASHAAQNHWQWWQQHSELFGRRQSHGLSAIAELLVLLHCCSSQLVQSLQRLSNSVKLGRDMLFSRSRNQPRRGSASEATVRRMRSGCW